MFILNLHYLCIFLCGCLDVILYICFVVVVLIKKKKIQQHMNNPALSKAVLNCSVNANRPEPSRVVPRSGKAP